MVRPRGAKFAPRAFILRTNRRADYEITVIFVTETLPETSLRETRINLSFDRILSPRSKQDILHRYARVEPFSADTSGEQGATSTLSRYLKKNGASWTSIRGVNLDGKILRLETTPNCRITGINNIEVC